MKRSLFTILTLFIHLFLFSQYSFEKTLGTIDNDEGYSIIQCEDDGYFIVGYTSDLFYGYANPYIIKTDEAGDVIWVDTPGRPEFHESAIAGIQTFDKGYAVICEDYGEGYLKSHMIKYSQDGTIDWANEYPTEGNNLPRGLIQVSDSGYVICGNADNNTTTRWDHYPFVLRTDKSGTLDWYKEVDLTYGYHTFQSVEIAYNSGYVTCGVFDPLTGYSEEALVVKITESGNVPWHKEIGNDYFTESANTIKKTNDFGYIMCGTIFKGPMPISSNNNILLIKTDSLGSVLWEKQIDLGENERAYDLDVLADNGFIITGSIQDTMTLDYDLLLVRTDEYGDTLWTRIFGGQYWDRGYSVCATRDGGFAICGLTKSFGYGGSDVYFIKTDENGIMTSIDTPISEDVYVDIYPNPTMGIINVTPNFHVIELVLFNAKGQIMAKEKPKHALFQFDFNQCDCPARLYYLVLRGTNKAITKKIILQ